MRPYLMCPLALAMFVSPLQAQLVFRSGVDLVHLGVTVVGKDGQPVSGLRAEDFVIQEEGREQGIAYFTRGLDNDLETMPLHLGVLFDASGSMDRDAGFAKTAAIKFLRDLNFAVDMTLVSFDTEVRVSRFGQSDFPRLVERLRGQETGGMTALYDALGGGNCKAGELAAQLLYGRIPLTLDVGLSPCSFSIYFLFGFFQFFFAKTLGNSPCLCHHLLPFSSSFCNLICHICSRVGGFFPGRVGLIQALFNSRSPLIDHFQQGLVQQRVQDPEQYYETNYLGDQPRRVYTKCFHAPSACDQ